MRDLELLLPYRLRTVKVGIQATVPAIALLGLYPLVPGAGPVATVPYYIALGIALGAVAGVAALPWRRLFTAGHGVTFLYVWSIGDIVIISTLVAMSGGSRSPLWSVYLLTTVFFAASYPVWGQVGLLAFTAVGYVGACLLTTGATLVGDVGLRIGMLGLLAFMASFLSRELLTQMAHHRAERDVSTRRAELLATVAEAARLVHSLDPNEVLKAVADACIAIGFDVGGVASVDDPDGAYRVLAARGVPESHREAAHPLRDGLLGAVVNAGSSVIVDATRPGPLRDDAGLAVRAAVATPVRSQGRLVAVVAVARSTPVHVAADEVESIELLAALAGRALENANLFEMEHEAVERLERLDGLKRDFVSTISHEMRTPLTVIYGLGRTITQRWSDLADRDREAAMRRIVANAESLNRTITSLLDFSRFESGGLAANVQPVNVSAFVTTQVDRLHDVLTPRPVHVEADEGQYTLADPALLERAIENLLVNAATHTPKDTVVAVSVHTVASSVHVTVRDEGPGIPPEELPQITDRFYRGGDPDRRPTRGLGLGLALVQEILVLHGSTLEVQSTVGEGTSFSFRLEVLDGEFSRGASREARHSTRPGTRAG